MRRYGRGQGDKGMGRQGDKGKIRGQGDRGTR